MHDQTDDGTQARIGDQGDTAERRAFAQQFIDALPHARALGLRVDQIGQGEVTISMPWAAHLVGDPDSGVVHGGVVSALMDTCSGTAVFTHPTRPASTATLGLRIDYMRAARPHQRITARAVCYHVTRNVAFVRVTAEDETPGIPVATGNGTFTLERPA